MKNRNREIIDKLYKLFGVSNPYQFQRQYSAADQGLMKSGKWNADDGELDINIAKNLIESLDFTKLTEEEREWFSEVRWFWYHHAISCERIKVKAQRYANRALKVQPSDSRNKVTKLLWYLVHDDFDGARTWLKTSPESWVDIEYKTGTELIDEISRHKFWF